MRGTGTNTLCGKHDIEKKKIALKRGNGRKRKDDLRRAISEGFRKYNVMNTDQINRRLSNWGTLLRW